MLRTFGERWWLPHECELLLPALSRRRIMQRPRWASIGSAVRPQAGSLEGGPGDRWPVPRRCGERLGSQQPVGPFPHRPHLRWSHVLGERNTQRAIQSQSDPAQRLQHRGRQRLAQESLTTSPRSALNKPHRLWVLTAHESRRGETLLLGRTLLIWGAGMRWCGGVPPHHLCFFFLSPRPRPEGEYRAPLR
jgi:hypothetical protein